VKSDFLKSQFHSIADMIASKPMILFILLLSVSILNVASWILTKGNSFNPSGRKNAYRDLQSFRLSSENIVTISERTAQGSLLKEEYLLNLIVGTEEGLQASSATKREVKRVISELTEKSDNQMCMPLSDPRLFGLYNVSFVDSGESQKANPAGG
jgi:hypothetical protein